MFETLPQEKYLMIKTVLYYLLFKKSLKTHIRLSKILFFPNLKTTPSFYTLWNTFDTSSKTLLILRHSSNDLEIVCVTDKS